MTNQCQGDANKMIGILKKRGNIIVGIVFTLITEVQAEPSNQKRAELEGDIRVLLVAQNEAQLSSQMNGRITQFNVDEGDLFKKGEVLLAFDCKEQQANLQMSEAELTIAKKTYQAQLKLAKMSAASKLDVAIAAAEVEKAKATNDLNQVVVQRCVVEAPYDGWVVQRLANPYENVAFGAPLLTIIDNTPLQLDLFVPSHWLSWLNVGHGFTLKIDETGKHYSALVQTIGAKVDSASQTVAVKASLTGKQKELLAGMSGTANF
ncbi:efflux RND transporter periplasmic adaptor subunit [Spartinivicinus marinus]|nr:efflux RND transporter periplasmic adaptor subunit [Spartinivicinus marinus]MCX4029327.1 efflux RND transporter periplasmic adaptor subunit [Spartinivicinus marinus]